MIEIPPIRKKLPLWEQSFYSGDRLQAEVTLLSSYFSQMTNRNQIFEGINLIHRSHGVISINPPSSEFLTYCEELSLPSSSVDSSEQLLPIFDIPDAIMYWYLHFKVPSMCHKDSIFRIHMLLRFLRLLSFRYPRRPDLFYLSLIQDGSSAVFRSIPAYSLSPSQCYSRSEAFLPQFQIAWSLGHYESMWLGCLHGQLDGRKFSLTDHHIRGFSVIGEAARSLSLFRKLYERNPRRFELTSISNLLFMSVGAEVIDHSFIAIISSHFNALADHKFAVSSIFSQRTVQQPLVVHEKPVVVVYSSDLRQHPVGRFWLPIARQLRSTFKVISIAGHPQDKDHIRDELRELSDEWWPFEETDTFHIAKRIHELSPSFLIDLGGHTADNHPELLTQRLAKVQVSYLGFYGPTYAKCCDWWIVDHHLMNWISNSYPNSESLWSLPGPSLCYVPELHNIPSPLSIIYDEPSHPVYGSFNHTRKLSYSCQSRFGSVLSQNSNAVLKFRSHSFQDTAVRRRFLMNLIGMGIDTHQLIPLLYANTYRDAMKDYTKIHLHFDSFPVSGTTTTLDSLAMGIPVLTTPTPYYAGAISSAILCHAGLSDHICSDVNELASHARWLANRYHSASSRRQLALEVRNSPLCDSSSMPKMFIQQLQLMLRQKCIA